SCIDSIQAESAIASLMFLGSVRLTMDNIDIKCAYLTNQHDVTTSPPDDMTVGAIVGFGHVGEGVEGVFNGVVGC
nr:hypothetical protein [Tanacetum cinerariifolium]